MKTSGGADRGRGAPWRGAAALGAALVLVLGALFGADSSGNADGAHYRRMTEELLATGRLPVAPLEWYHPGHYAAAAGLARLDAWIRDGKPEVLRAIVALNLLVLAGLAAEAARFAAIRDPEGGPAPPLFAALAAATVPGPLWHARDCMSDVAGHGLVAIAILRLLAVRRGGDLVFAGLLFGVALGFRMSALGFLPLALVAAWRARGVPRFLAAAAFVPGALALWLLLSRDLFPTLEVLSERSADNSLGLEALGRLPEALPIWAGSWARGLGPPLGLAALVGLLALLWRGLRRPAAAGPLLLGVGGLLPYLLLVLSNRQFPEWRYQIPVVFLGLAIAPAAIGALRRGLGGRVALGAALALPAASLGLALPFLKVISERSSFVEVGARTMVAEGPEEALRVGVECAPWIELLRPRGLLLPLRSKDAEGPGYGLGWEEGRRRLRLARGAGLPALIVNEIGAEGFRADLRRRGWREREIARREPGTLRNRRDASWVVLDPALAEVREPLLLLEIQAPEVTLTAERREEVLVLELRAPALAGRAYEILVGTPPVGGERPWRYGDLSLPLSPEDPAVRASRELGERPTPGVAGLRGVLDGLGRAQARLPGALVAGRVELRAFAVVHGGARRDPASAHFLGGPAPLH